MIWPWRGPAALWGAFHACRVTNPCTFWGWSEKGTHSPCSAALLFLPLLPSHTQWVPMAIACLVAASQCKSPAASPRARWEPGALAPQGFGQGGLSLFHHKETLSFIQARKLPVLLPGIIQCLHDAKTNTKTKALLLIRNVMEQVQRKQASSIALQVAADILPLFDDECSQVQELSICLYKKVMQVVVWFHKRQMKKVVRRGLLPLFFYMSDQTQSVAKASMEALVTAAEFLKRKDLKHLAQTQQTWRIAECLLVQDKGMVEEYLQHSLLYLQHIQAPLREAAVRFIGLAAQHCKDQSEKNIQKICSALQPMQYDEELRVVSLATQTVFILGSRAQPASRWRRWALCC
ncbi:uncharacterized protein LOC118155461 [Oxyura jamaicensis]|uniref:uncharacterized protein LOC118155461 n=1 Tax=Oxyura jamaicensis TaxID=8884 RepID=UPI0015A68AD7|nr:uncharacterized protein LOC118155461 [Oxyura jamaicensis]